jgi:hypothetical protein
MTRGAKNPRGCGARTTRDTNNQAGKSGEKGDPPKVPRTHPFSQVASNNRDKPPKVDSTFGLAVESPASEPPKDQGHSIEESERGGHDNLIEELENYISSEISLWGEKFLGMGYEAKISKQKETITFEFPIQESDGIIQMKNFCHLLCQIFVVCLARTLIPSSLNLLSFVEAITIFPMPTS